MYIVTSLCTTIVHCKINKINNIPNIYVAASMVHISDKIFKVNKIQKSVLFRFKFVNKKNIEPFNGTAPNYLPKFFTNINVLIPTMSVIEAINKLKQFNYIQNKCIGQTRQSI